MATINEFLKAVGHVRIETRDATTGELKDRREFDNLTLTLGKSWIAGRCGPNPPAALSHMAIGTDGTAPALADNALHAEIARVALDVAGGTLNGAVLTLAGTFGPGIGTGALQEAGLLNAGAGGTLTNRVSFGVVTKGASDVTTITWTITIQ